MAEPQYRQIADDLRRQIESGELAPGAQLPIESELGKQYKASRNTIRDAVRWLTNLDLVETRPGQGTFVTVNYEPFVVDLGAPADFSGVASGTGEDPASLRWEFTSPQIEIQEADGLVAAELGLPEGEPVVSRHQRRFIGGVPWSLQSSFYPMAFVENGASRLISPEDITEGTVRYLRETLGMTQVGWKDRLTIRTADAQESDFFRLRTNRQVSVAEVIRTGYDQDGRPMRVTVTVYPADRNQFVTTTGDVPSPGGQAAGSPDPAGSQAADDRAPAIFALER